MLCGGGGVGLGTYKQFSLYFLAILVPKIVFFSYFGPKTGDFKQRLPDLWRFLVLQLCCVGVGGV